jgi:alkyl hydroperoxide reductase subunit AhpF
MRRTVQTRLLNDQLIGQIEQLFEAQFKHPVELLFFGSESSCEACEDIKQLLEEINDLSPKIHLQNYDLDEQDSMAKKYNVQVAPALVVAGRAEDGTILDFGIRLIGTPSGYEFSSLIQAIILVSKRDSGLKAEFRAKLNRLKDRVNLQVFVTPT